MSSVFGLFFLTGCWMSEVGGSAFVFGPSEVRAISGANLGRTLFWSERSECDQRSYLRGPQFLVIDLFLLLLAPPLLKSKTGLL